MPLCGRGWSETHPLLAHEVNSFADQLDDKAVHVAQAAALMNALASYLRRAGPVIRAAKLCVLNPAWAGVADEDVALEKALRDGGWL